MRICSIKTKFSVHQGILLSQEGQLAQFWTPCLTDFSKLCVKKWSSVRAKFSEIRLGRRTGFYGCSTQFISQQFNEVYAWSYH